MRTYYHSPPAGGAAILWLLLCWLALGGSPLKAQFGFEFTDLLEESETFSPGAGFIWLGYHALGTTGDRPDRSATLIPPVSLHAERHLLLNVGLRLEVGTHFWEEQKVLAESSTESFLETLEYRYLTFGLGGTWHFAVGEKIDPYVGLMATHRRTRAFCDCFDEKDSSTTIDPLVGVRYFLSEKTFGMLEFGSHGLGKITLGLGIKLN